MFEYLEKRKVALIYIPLIVYWIVLLVGTTLPATDVPSFGVSDKFKHFGAYFGLAVLLSFTLHYQGRNLLLKKYFLISAWIIASFYGMLDELHQRFIPGRSAEFLDWFDDALGAVAGCIFVYYVMKLLKYYPGTLSKADQTTG